MYGYMDPCLTHAREPACQPYQYRRAAGIQVSSSAARSAQQLDKHHVGASSRHLPAASSPPLSSSAAVGVAIGIANCWAPRLKLNGMYVAIVARQAACCTSGHLKPYPMDLLRSNSKYIRLLAQGRRGSVPGTAINPIRGAGLPRRAGRPPHGTSACNAYPTSVHRIVFLLRRTPQILALCHGFLYQSHSFTFQGASRSAQGPAPPPVPPSRHRIGKP